MREVSIVIPNFNGIKYLKDCLDSLAAQTMSADVIVVDNGSTDGSEKICEEYDKVKLVKLDRNYGFCRAVNEGIRQCAGRYVILLNNDTKAEPSFTEELYKAIDPDPEVFSAAAKMLRMDDPSTIDSAGDLYCALGWAFSLGKDSPAGRYDRPARIFSACAGAAIYRKDLVDSLGGFDEAHVSYLEDVDIGYRARIAGYRNIYAPKAVVLHAGSGTTGSRHNPYKIRQAAANGIYVIYKNMPVLQIIINLPFLLAGMVIKAAFFTAKGYGGDYLAGLGQGFGLCAGGTRPKHRLRDTGRYCLIQLELWLNMIRRICG